MMRMRIVHAAFVVCGIVACGTRPTTGLTPREVTELRPTVQVSNVGGSDVTVNLVRDEVRFRLGRVRAQATEVYSVAHPMLVGARVYVEVIGPGRHQGHVVGPVGLAPRSGVRVVIGDIPELTTDLVRAW
jgi:hypothetical protein